MNNSLDFIIAFCDKNNEEMDIPYQEVFHIIDLYSKIINSFNYTHSKNSNLKIAFKTTTKGSLETWLKIFETGKELYHFAAEYPELKDSLILAAQDSGILISPFHYKSIIDLLLLKKGEKINDKQVIKKNNNVYHINNNYGTIIISDSVYEAYNDPSLRKVINDLGEAIKDSDSFDHIEIRDPDTKKKISRITKKDSKYLEYNPDDDYDEVREHIEIVSIINSCFVGQAQWVFKAQNYKFKAKITDLEWLSDFQKGKFNFNAKCKLKVTIIQKIKIVKNFPPKLITTEIAKVHEIIKPPLQGHFLP